MRIDTVWKPIASIGIVAMAALILAGYGSPVAASADPEVTVQPTDVKLNKKSKVMIKGVGFEPNEQVHLVIHQEGLLPGDLTNLFNPPLVVDSNGNFSVEWTVGRWSRFKKLGEATISITDDEYKVRSAAKLTFIE